MSKSTKKRNWAFVLYPESAPQEWRELLQKTGLQCAISPLHNKDINPDNTPKKEHYHIILAYSGPTSFSVVKKLTEQLKQPRPIPLEQIRGYYRYFTHLDNPEKYQYNDKDITTINGFNITDYVELTRSEIQTIKNELQLLIREHGIIEYSELMDYLQDCEDKSIEYEVASNNTYFFDKYITSKRHLALVDARGSQEHGEQGQQHARRTEAHEICCPNCGSFSINKKGKTAAGTQRYKCNNCEKFFTE